MGEPHTDGAAHELEELRARLVVLASAEVRRKKAEDELYKSEEQFRAIVEAMTDGLGVQDENGALTYVNDTLCSMTGYSREEVLGHSALDFIDKTHHEFFIEQVSKRERRERESYELMLRTKGGATISTIASPGPIYNARGEFIGSFAVITDITERKHTEEALQNAYDALAKERNLLRTLMDTLPDIIYIKDPQSRFVATNTAHLKLLGVEDESDVIGKTDFDFHSRELAEEYFADEREVLRTGRPLESKVERIVLRGETTWRLTFKAPLRDAEGLITGLVGIGRDITELRAAQDALLENEERLRLILENSRDVAYKINLDTKRFEYVSPSVERLLGYKPEEILALDIERMAQLIHPDDREAVISDFLSQSAGTASESTGIVEHRLRHKDGTYRWMARSSSPVYDGGRLVAKVGAFRDMTESKQAEEALRTASRMEATSTLAGGIAHDFNNLMVGVLGNAELLELRFGDDPDATRMLSKIQQSAQRAGELAHEMLAFARGGKYQPRIVDLNSTIDEVLRFQGRSFPRAIHVECEKQDDLWPVTADPPQMNQVVTNLLLNAVESIEDKGRIVITTRNIEIDDRFARQHAGLKPGRHVYLAVEDTGCGMDSEVQSRVFEPFFTTKFQGRGLGLAAVYGIIKNHGGHVSVYSQMTRGTSFKVYLPVLKSALFDERAAAVSRLPKGEEVVLLIDDEEIVLGATREILEHLGYRVLCARNGQEAVDIARTYDGLIHLAVLDMSMPIMGGAEAYPLLMEARPALKVIVCSGYELDSAAQSVLDAGASAFLRKPCRTARLASVIRDALTSPSAE